ncbi:MAG: hypothetical protein V2I43_25335 [Parvularcula sp.]|jgi:hypothetical protein|nr:hypothetical protein [Parvularcula sp.]
MKLPKPEEGLIINYSFLWKHEADQGREEGRKDRPCAVILAHENGRVAVAPITHTPPKGAEAIEIPAQVKQQLGLDHERSWLVTNQANHFTWPGHDIRPINRQNPDRMIYGKLPPGMARAVKQEVRRAARDRQLAMVDRDEEQKPKTDRPRRSSREIAAEKRGRSKGRTR